MTNVLTSDGNATRQTLFIVNFEGIGNGIGVLPLLKRLEEISPDCVYYHTANPVLETPAFVSWAGLQRFLGTTPSIWRRFNPSDWEAITHFLQTKRVDVVINLRNQGPFRDVQYYHYKQAFTPSRLVFWDLDDLSSAQRSSNSSLSQAALFGAKGLEIGSFRRYWLYERLASEGISRPKQREIGFCPGASQEVKRWPADCWIQLGGMLLAHTQHRIVIYAGPSVEEVQFAQRVVHGLKSEKFDTDRIQLIAGKSLMDYTMHLSGLDLLISVDTCSVHIGAALGIPTVGLYFSTDANIWGGLSDSFIPIQSQYGLRCSEFNADSGNCQRFYSGCPAPCKDAVTPQRVFQVTMSKFFAKQPIGEGIYDDLIPLLY